MLKPERLLEAVKKAQQYLLSQQGANGSWYFEKTHKEPPFYQKPLIMTSEAIQALALFPDTNSMAAVSKGLNFLTNEATDENDPVDLHAWKLLALTYSNTHTAEKEVLQLAKTICAKQTQGGYWKTFPNTFNLTNYYSILALNECGHSENLEKAKKWFLKTKAKDGHGWGFDNNAEESEVSFTCNVALALLTIGEDPLKQELHAVKEFLESTQLKDGGWPSSKMTISNKSTTYATALALMALMQLSDNPFNKKIEAGIKFLLQAQSEEGFWPLVQGEKKFDVYPNLYVIQTLAIYAFFIEKSNSSTMSALRGRVRAEHLNQHIVCEFFRQTKEKFKGCVLRNIVDSRVLGITQKAIERRKEILNILSKRSELEPAEIIDNLKLIPAHQYLNKKSHLTQIKADIDFLRSLNMVYETNGKYFVTHKII